MKKFSKQVLSVMLVAFAMTSQLCFADQHVSGNVKTPDNLGSLAIHGTKVTIDGTDLKAFTDDNGAYVFSNVTLINGSITAEKIGFEVQTKTLREVVNFELIPTQETGFWQKVWNKVVDWVSCLISIIQTGHLPEGYGDQPLV